jgi:hypothetical protein
MTLEQALTNKIVIPKPYDNQWVYFCATCGKYLCYYLGKYCFQCSCHDDKLEAK